MSTVLMVLAVRLTTVIAKTQLLSHALVVV